MSFDTKAMLVGMLPGVVRRPLMTAYYKRESAGRGDAELMYLPRLVPAHGTALDIGAHIGIYTYALSRIADRVIAVEPNPAMAKFLRGQRFKGVEVREMAMSSRDGDAVLSVPQDGAGLGTLRADLTDPDAAHLPVRSSRLDSLDLGRIDFIKVDVEGFEEEAIAGGIETIRRDNPVLLIEIEERHNSGALARLTAQLGGLGYSAYFLDRANWRPIDEFSMETHQNVERYLRSMEVGRGPDDPPYINNFLFLPQGRTTSGLN